MLQLLLSFPQGPEPAQLCGLQWSFPNLHTQKMHLCKMHFSIPNGASSCRDLPSAGGFSDSGIRGVARSTWAFVLIKIAIGF